MTDKAVLGTFHDLRLVMQDSGGCSLSYTVLALGWSFVVLDFNGLNLREGLTWGSHILYIPMGVWVLGWSFVVLDFNGLNLREGLTWGSHILYTSMGVWALGWSFVI